MSVTLGAIFLFGQPFPSWGTEHVLWLLAGAASMLVWISIGRQQSDESAKRKVGLVMGLIPALIWTGASLYSGFSYVPVDWGFVLPFHVCYFLNLLMPVMLWRKSFFLFEVSYFMVMAGCLQGLLTPDLDTVFPHYINIRYFFVHIGLVQSILYAVFVYGFRPTWSGMGKSLLWTNIYLVFVAGINLALGTNFMYVCSKPPTTTLLDLFGDWPWYLLGGELLAVALFFVVFLPFAFRWRFSR